MNSNRSLHKTYQYRSRYMWVLFCWKVLEPGAYFRNSFWLSILPYGWRRFDCNKHIRHAHMEGAEPIFNLECAMIVTLFRVIAALTSIPTTFY